MRGTFFKKKLVSDLKMHFEWVIIILNVIKINVKRTNEMRNYLYELHASLAQSFNFHSYFKLEIRRT